MMMITADHRDIRLRILSFLKVPLTEADDMTISDITPSL